MPMWLYIVIAAIVVLFLIGIVASVVRRRRLRSRFGPEYARTREERGRLGTPGELRGREKRVDRLDIVPLSQTARQRYAQQWRMVQTKFVDQPSDALRDAYSPVTA